MEGVRFSDLENIGTKGQWNIKVDMPSSCTHGSEMEARRRRCWLASKMGISGKGPCALPLSEMASL